MYCPIEKKKKTRKIYVIPVSPRLKSTIFAMSKAELIMNTSGQHQNIIDFVKNMDETETLLNLYKNLPNMPLSVARRKRIKMWLESNGAEFYTLDVLLQYKWNDLIGKGAYSTAHLIINRYDETKRVLKIGMAKKMDKKMFYREMNILKSINHPSIIKLYEFGIQEENEAQIDNCIFWSLNNYCNTGNLQTYIKNSYQIPFTFRYLCNSQILEAIYYIHNRNIIHRDIKPANIFLHDANYDFTFKLGDFNLARKICSTDTTLSFCGTPCYMAPEIIDKQIYTDKADLWSYLCVMIELISLTHINPILKSTEELLELLNCNIYESKIIQLLHFIDPNSRANTKEVYDFQQEYKS